MEEGREKEQKEEQKEEITLLLKELHLGKKKTLKIENYNSQAERWPRHGRYILAQYDEDSVLVYQAYRTEIGNYAVENQKFGGPYWNSRRMTWIKTNFLWMMYRSGWGRKHNQEMVLGIWLKRSSFDRILSRAARADKQQQSSEEDETSTGEDRFFVRLQWDPDHRPNGDKHLDRKAIQLGVKRMDTYMNGEDIVEIQDLSDFVKQQYTIYQSGKLDQLETPSEREYLVEDKNTAKGLNVGPFSKETFRESIGRSKKRSKKGK